MIALKCGRIINIKPGRVGGFLPSKPIHDVCAGSDIPVWCGGMLESGVGRAYNVALASLPNFSLPGDLSPSARYWARDIVTPGVDDERRREGARPRRPGLGVSIDTDLIESLTVQKHVLSAASPMVAVAAAARNAPSYAGFTDLALLSVGTVIGSGIYLVPSVVLRQSGLVPGWPARLGVGGTLSLLGALRTPNSGRCIPMPAGCMSTSVTHSARSRHFSTGGQAFS